MDIRGQGLVIVLSEFNEELYRLLDETGLGLAFKSLGSIIIRRGVKRQSFNLLIVDVEYIK